VEEDWVGPVQEDWEDLEGLALPVVLGPEGRRPVTVT
jgi:hypothetical protein